MTKKDFIALADELRLSYRAGLIPPQVLQDLCDFCKRQNPAFNRERWLGYLAGECGPNGGPVKGKATSVAR